MPSRVHGPCRQVGLGFRSVAAGRLPAVSTIREIRNTYIYIYICIIFPGYSIASRTDKRNGMLKKPACGRKSPTGTPSSITSSSFASF